MKITFEKSELLNALNLVNGACGALNTLPILSCVLIRGEAGTVEITGNNLEVTIQVEAPAVLERDGAIAVPAKRLLALVKELPANEPIIFEADKERLGITCGGDTYNMAGLNADEYPARSEVEGETFTMTCRELQSILRQTEFAASKEEFRYELNAIYFNQREVVATDSNIMAKVACPIQTPQFTIPLQTAKELQKTLKQSESYVTVTVGTNRISFASDCVTLTSRLIEGEYPFYWKVIPQKYWLVSPKGETKIEPLTHEHSVTVSKSEFLRAVKRVSVFANDRTFLIILDIGGGEIGLSCEDTEGDSTASVACSGEDAVRIGLNTYALLEILARVDGESLTIEFEDALQAILFKSSDTDDFIGVISPMRLE